MFTTSNEKGSLEAHIHARHCPIVETIEEEIKFHFPVHEFGVVLEVLEYFSCGVGHCIQATSIGEVIDLGGQDL